jgi:general stress protein 26
MTTAANQAASAASPSRAEHARFFLSLEASTNPTNPGTGELPQLRSRMQQMCVATLSNVDQDGVLRSDSLQRWEMDDSGALWFFTVRGSSANDHMQAFTLSFSDAERSKHISLSGRVEIFAESLCTEYLLGSIWMGAISMSRHNRDSRTLLRFTPQTVVYWQAPQSLLARLLQLLAVTFSGKFARFKRRSPTTATSPSSDLSSAKSAL